MTTAERIRRLALGPAPEDSCWLSSWTGDCGYVYWVIGEALRPYDSFGGFNSDDERRMFFLFVAEADME